MVGRGRKQRSSCFHGPGTLLAAANHSITPEEPLSGEPSSYRMPPSHTGRAPRPPLTEMLPAWRSGPLFSPTRLPSVCLDQLSNCAGQWEQMSPTLELSSKQGYDILEKGCGGAGGAGRTYLPVYLHHRQGPAGGHCPYRHHLRNKNHSTPLCPIPTDGSSMSTSGLSAKSSIVSF